MSNGLWAHKDWTGPLGNQVGDHNVDGGLFGGQVGCDYQAPGHVVIGIQGDYDGANATGSNSNLTTTHIYQTHITALSSVTGRIGYSWAQLESVRRGEWGVIVDDQPVGPDAKTLRILPIRFADLACPRFN